MRFVRRLASFIVYRFSILCCCRSADALHHRCLAGRADPGRLCPAGAGNADRWRSSSSTRYRSAHSQIATSQCELRIIILNTFLVLASIVDHVWVPAALRTSCKSTPISTKLTSETGLTQVIGIVEIPAASTTRGARLTIRGITGICGLRRVRLGCFGLSIFTFLCHLVR